MSSPNAANTGPTTNTNASSPPLPFTAVNGRPSKETSPQRQQSKSALTPKSTFSVSSATARPLYSTSPLHVRANPAPNFKRIANSSPRRNCFIRNFHTLYSPHRLPSLILRPLPTLRLPSPLLFPLLSLRHRRRHSSRTNIPICIITHARHRRRRRRLRHPCLRNTRDTTILNFCLLICRIIINTIILTCITTTLIILQSRSILRMSIRNHSLCRVISVTTRVLYHQHSLQPKAFVTRVTSIRALQRAPWHLHISCKLAAPRSAWMIRRMLQSRGKRCR